jgi:hypothetical protein
MAQPKAYKKHLKRASDLFWMPPDDSTPMSHWKFDESYSVVKREQFRRQELPSVIEREFTALALHPFPVPQFEQATVSDADSLDRSADQPHLTRSFLPFPNGFWSELHSNERHMVMPGPVGFF